MGNKLRGVAVGVLLLPCCAAADIRITEIMYDLTEGSDSGREWIEVYNDGLEAVDLAKLKLVENGSNHKISGGPLAPGTYAVIADNPAKFKNDYPAYAGQVFDSAFSLNNSGENLALHDAKGVVLDEALYTEALGGKGTGDSLQRAPGTSAFEAGMPTPGAGIPAGGLVKTPQKPKAGGKKTAQPAAAPAPVAIVGESRARIVEEAQIAAAAPVSSLVWGSGVFSLALVGAVGTILARRARKEEWEIIEES